MSKKIFLYSIGVIAICLAASTYFLTNFTHLQMQEKKKVSVENIRIENYFVQGQNQQIFDKVPQRVIALGENQVETLIEIGAQSHIIMAVASVDESFPIRPRNQAIFDELTKGKDRNMNMEYVMRLQPDLILGQQYHFTRTRLYSTDYWNQHGVKTLVNLSSSQPRRHYLKETVDKEMQTIRDYGKVFQVEAAAEKIVKETYDIIDLINKRAKNYPKPKVMIVEMMSSFVSYDDSKLAGNMAEKIGADVSSTPALITFEHIAKENPDVLILICSDGKYASCPDRIYKHPALQHLSCVQNRRVHYMPLKYTYGPLCRTIDGIKMMASYFYPGIDISL